MYCARRGSARNRRCSAHVTSARGENLENIVRRGRRRALCVDRRQRVSRRLLKYRVFLGTRDNRRGFPSVQIHWTAGRGQLEFPRLRCHRGCAVTPTETFVVSSVTRSDVASHPTRATQRTSPGSGTSDFERSPLGSVTRPRTPSTSVSRDGGRDERRGEANASPRARE